MRRERKKPEPEQEAGAPEWMVTFSDCMTLLLTFFVLLLSFSSFDENLFRKLKVIFENQFSISLQNTRDKEAFLATELIQYPEDLDKGSEKPTLTRGAEDKLIKETEPVNFREHKVFMSSSEEIFWGNGTAISLQGQKALSAMASFLKEVPGRIVVSENGQGDEKDSEHLGLQRAWAVIEYFTTKQGLDKALFSISASTLQKSDNNLQDSSQVTAARTLEIVLLERSIYN